MKETNEETGQTFAIHSTAISQDHPQLKYKRVDKLPLDRLTHYS